MKKHYYYVRWVHALRFAEAYSIEDACKDAYGMVSTDMEVKDLGTRHPRYFSNKKKFELQNDPKDWIKPQRNNYNSKKGN